MKYAIVIEKINGSYSAYVPDLPGCVACGPTPEAVESEIRLAIELHLTGMREDGIEVPNPTSTVEYIKVA